MMSRAGRLSAGLSFVLGTDFGASSSSFGEDGDPLIFANISSISNSQFSGACFLVVTPCDLLASMCSSRSSCMISSVYRSTDGLGRGKVLECFMSGLSRTVSYPSSEKMPCIGRKLWELTSLSCLIVACSGNKSRMEGWEATKASGVVGVLYESAFLAFLDAVDWSKYLDVEPVNALERAEDFCEGSSSYFTLYWPSDPGRNSGSFIFPLAIS